MSTYQKVAWSEGMFLQPQHFQQLERFLEYRFSRSQDHIAPYHWGIMKLDIGVCQESCRLKF
jgi:type VI secretion system protein ImpJ